MTDRVDVHVYLHTEPEGVTPQMRHVLQALGILRTQGEQIIMATAEIKAQMARIDKATNDISARISALIAKVGTGMSEADVAEVTAGLEAEATKLEGIASDPDNPVT